MALWAAVAAAVVKVPTEKNLAVRFFWLRELLDRGIISRLRWCDTRDMTADAHTKGSIDRSALLRLMRGVFRFEHAVKDFKPCKIIMTKEKKYDPVEADRNHPFAHLALDEAHWRQEIISEIRVLYETHNPVRLAQFHNLCVKYSGHEEEWRRMMLWKYEGGPHPHPGSVPGARRDRAEAELEPPEAEQRSVRRRLQDSQCRNCGGYGHWGNECTSVSSKSAPARRPGSLSLGQPSPAADSFRTIPPWRKEPPPWRR